MQSTIDPNSIRVLKTVIDDNRTRQRGEDPRAKKTIENIAELFVKTAVDFLVMYKVIAFMPDKDGNIHYYSLPDRMKETVLLTDKYELDIYRNNKAKVAEKMAEVIKMNDLSNYIKVEDNTIGICVGRI